VRWSSPLLLDDTVQTDLVTCLTRQREVVTTGVFACSATEPNHFDGGPVHGGLQRYSHFARLAVLCSELLSWLDSKCYETVRMGLQSKVSSKIVC
jgi:hypothetical protein